MCVCVWNLVSSRLSYLFIWISTISLTGYYYTCYSHTYAIAIPARSLFSSVWAFGRTAVPSYFKWSAATRNNIIYCHWNKGGMPVPMHALERASDLARVCACASVARLLDDDISLSLTKSPHVFHPAYHPTKNTQQIISSNYANARSSQRAFAFTACFAMCTHCTSIPHTHAHTLETPDQRKMVRTNNRHNSAHSITKCWYVGFAAPLRLRLLRLWIGGKSTTVNWRKIDTNECRARHVINMQAGLERSVGRTNTVCIP